MFPGTSIQSQHLLLLLPLLLVLLVVELVLLVLLLLRLWLDLGLDLDLDFVAVGRGGRELGGWAMVLVCVEVMVYCIMLVCRFVDSSMLGCIDRAELSAVSEWLWRGCSDVCRRSEEMRTQDMKPSEG